MRLFPLALVVLVLIPSLPAVGPTPPPSGAVFERVNGYSNIYWNPAALVPDYYSVYGASSDGIALLDQTTDLEVYVPDTYPSYYVSATQDGEESERVPALALWPSGASYGPICVDTMAEPPYVVVRLSCAGVKVLRPTLPTLP